MAKLKAVVLRRWPILIVTLVIGTIAGFVSTSAGPQRGVTVYQASQVVLANRLAGNPASVSQDSLKVTRGDVPKRAAEILGEPENADALARRVQATGEADSNSIQLVVSDVDPERASKVVQAFAQAFLDVVNVELRSEDTRQLTQLQERLTEAKGNLEAFDTQNGFIVRGDVVLPQSESVDALIAERQRLTQAVFDAQNKVEQFQLTTSSRAPYSTLGPEAPKVADSQLIEVPESPLFRAGLLGLIGLLLGVGLVLIIERVHQRIDTRDELAALIAVPIIAEIGKIRARRRPADETGKLDLDGIWSEHYRRVRSAIQFVQADAASKARDGSGRGDRGQPGDHAVISGHRALSGDEPRIFLFASALPGEGKSTSVALTALALAETGSDTLVINADFRRPKVEDYLGTAHSPSLADRAELSVDRPSVDEVVQSTDVEHLWIAAGGPPTLEVGGRVAAAKEVAAEAAARGGTVLIDSSPLRVSNEPIDLLSAVDEVILVVRAGRTTVKSIQDTMELLEMHHAPILGVVLIGTLATREMYAYYASYYHKVQDKSDGGDATPIDEPESEVSVDPPRQQVPSYARVDHPDTSSGQAPIRDTGPYGRPTAPPIPPPVPPYTQPGAPVRPLPPPYGPT